MSEKRNDGGPVFPCKVQVDGIARFERHPGMTLRDYFAGQALAGACANHGYLLAARELAKTEGGDAADHVAAAAYQFADAMLAEREK